MINYKFIFFVFLLAFLHTSCNDGSKERHFYDQAIYLDGIGNYSEAIIYWTKVIKENDKNIEAYVNRAVDFSYLGEYQKAIEDYTRVLNIDENNTLSFFNRGKNYIRIEDYTKAVSDFNSAVKTKGSEFLSVDKSNWLKPSEDYKYDVVLKEILYERGIANFYLENYEQALKDFEYCNGVNFEKKDVLQWKGYIYLNYGMTTEACNSFKEAKDLGNIEVYLEIKKYCE